VKHFAKLTLFFTLSFTGILVCASFLALLEDWTGQALLFPPISASADAGAAADAAHYMEQSLPAAFYLSLLLGLSYAARRRMAYPAVFAGLLVFSLVLSGAARLGLESLKRMGGFSLTTNKAPADLVKPGLILNTGSAMSGARTVFMDDPYRPGTARVLAVPGRPLVYAAQGTAQETPVRLPFGGGKNPFFGGIDEDLEHSARVFSLWFRAGLLPYGIYAGSLAVFLLSLGCLTNISFWSLANLFFAALAFRGALALESLLNQAHIHRLLASFAEGIVPESLVNPLIFAVLGILILLYSGLVYLARGRISDG
jgi:hypothetical protein